MPSHFAEASKQQLKGWTRLTHAKFRQADGLFLAEGVKVVEELFKSAWQVEALLTLPEKTAHWQELLSGRQQTPSSFPVYSITYSEFKKLSQDKEPEGLIAVVKTPDPLSLDAFLRSATAHLLIGHEMANPQNLGALLRTARWFGFSGLILGKNSVDWTHPKAIRASMGAVFRLSVFAGVELAYALAEVKKYYRLIGSDVRTGQNPAPVSEKAALLLGSESHGLPENLLQFADERWKIPGAGTESLSLPQAAAIMMYEMSRQ